MRELWYFVFEPGSVILILVAVAVGFGVRWNSSAYFWQPGVEFRGGGGGRSSGGSRGGLLGCCGFVFNCLVGLCP